MVKCDYPGCTETIEYLPFRCSYCGGTFCKKHRLPENHDCTFKLAGPKKTPPTPIRTSIPNGNSSSKTDEFLYRETHPGGDLDEDEELAAFLREEVNRNRRERARIPRRTSTNYNAGYGGYGGFGRRSGFQGFFNTQGGRPIATYWIIGLTLFFSILSFISPLRAFLLTNIQLISLGFVYTPITAIFIVDHGFSFFTIINIIFSIMIIWGIGKTLEYKYGSKFFFSYYLLSGLAASLSMIILQALGYISTGTQFMLNGFFISSWSAIYALIAYIIFLTGGETQFTILIFFIPVRLKGKHVLWFLIGFNVFMAIINLAVNNPMFIENIGNLIGFVVAKYVFNYKMRGPSPSQYI